MIRGIYTAAMGMLCEQAKVDQTANNLANAQTTGFKQDRIAFAAHLRRNMVRVEPEDPFRRKYPIGALETAVLVDEIRPWMAQGGLDQTDHPFDFALDGTGFFSIQAADGQIVYTRNGEFKLNANNQLTDSQGNLVLNDALEPVILNGLFTVDRNGFINQEGIVTGRLGIVDFENPEMLRKRGDNHYQSTAISGEPQEDLTTRVFQGSLELSNVNVVREMVNLIAAQRHFEITQRAVMTHDALMETAINRVGNVR
jgi:flagellar basal-body rod protein FlgF